MNGELELALQLVKHFEGFRSHPYLCAAGVPTIGYGSCFRLDGTRVELTDAPVTKQYAEQLALADIRRFMLKVAKLCPNLDTAGRKAALIDFAYNLGAGSLQASTLRRKVNAGLWDEVPAQLLRWRFAGGRELRGLLLRRTAEAALL